MAASAGSPDATEASSPTAASVGATSAPSRGREDAASDRRATGGLCDLRSMSSMELAPDTMARPVAAAALSPLPRRASCSPRRSPPSLTHLSPHSAAAAPQVRVAATSSWAGADGRRGGQRRRRRPAASSTPPPPPSLSTSFDGMRRFAERVKSSSGGAAAAGADVAVTALLDGEPALPRGAPAAGGVFLAPRKPAAAAAAGKRQGQG